jgi:transposase
VVDALGNPVRLALSPGQTHEMKLAYELLGDITNAYVAGDKAYDAAPLVELLKRNRCTVVIPSKADRAGQRAIDRHLYKERHLVECFFQRIKRFRRIAMRFEKLARNFLAFLHLACALVWLA